MNAAEEYNTPQADDNAIQLDEIDRQIVLLTQDGLPLHSRPYEVIAKQLNRSATEVMQRMRHMHGKGKVMKKSSED